MHDLIRAWRAFDVRRRPYVLPGDEVVLAPRFSERCRSWNAYCSNPDFGAPDENKFHLDLLPLPYSGKLAHAKVFVLLLNPGFGPHDYFAEFQFRKFRQMRIDNLRQSRNATFDYFNPQISWHGGYAYWHDKLSGLIRAFAKKYGISYGVARDKFASAIATVELVPYHSKGFSFPRRHLSELESVRLAKKYVHEVLLPAAAKRECLLIVTRALQEWGIRRPSTNVIAYGGGEARGGHLTPATRGGTAILEFMGKQYRNQTS